MCITGVSVKEHLKFRLFTLKVCLCTRAMQAKNELQHTFAIFSFNAFTSAMTCTRKGGELIHKEPVYVHCIHKALASLHELDLVLVNYPYT